MPRQTALLCTVHSPLVPQDAKRKGDEAQLDEWLKKYDGDRSGLMDRSEVCGLLTSVKRELTKDPSAEVYDEILDKIIMRYDKSGDGQLERSEILPAVRKYKSVLRQKLDEQRAMLDLFQRHDVDQSKRLTQAQLFSLLKELSVSKGVATPSVEADVAFVIEECDVDKSGASECLDAHRPRRRAKTTGTQFTGCFLTAPARRAQLKSMSWSRQSLPG